MKKRDIKFLALFVLSLLVIVVAVAAQQQAPTIPDKVALSIRDEQLKQAQLGAEFESLQRQWEQSPGGKRQQEIRELYQQSNARLSAVIKGACGDEQVWTVDPAALKDAAPLKCIPVPKPTPSPVASPAG